jgi:hypothetical protein
MQHVCTWAFDFWVRGVIVSLSLHHRLQSCTSPCGEEGPVPDSVQFTSSASSSMSAAAVLYHGNLCVSYSRWIWSHQRKRVKTSVGHVLPRHSFPYQQLPPCWPRVHLPISLIYFTFSMAGLCFSLMDRRVCSTWSLHFVGRRMSSTAVAGLCARLPMPYSILCIANNGTYVPGYWGVSQKRIEKIWKTRSAKEK